MKAAFAILIVAALAACQTVEDSAPTGRERFAAACLKAGHMAGSPAHDACIAKMARDSAATPPHLRLCHQNAGTVVCR